MLGSIKTCLVSTRGMAKASSLVTKTIRNIISS